MARSGGDLVRTAEEHRAASPDGRDIVTVPSRDPAAGYRPALDGIRAVAVMAVIAYHLGYRWAPGGFIGVDVFFVLSGYLITSLLLAEHARTGGIALAAFWFRRARRLLPALFAMLIVVAIWVGLSASPFEMPMRREDLFWTLFYGSNWHFVQSGQDYFAQYGSASPLRHTWSLAIEEQFYLLWPLMVVGALWIGRRRPVILAWACVVGIASSVAAMAILSIRWIRPAPTTEPTPARTNFSRRPIGSVHATPRATRAVPDRRADRWRPGCDGVLLASFAVVRTRAPRTTTGSLVCSRS